MTFITGTTLQDALVTLLEADADLAALFGAGFAVGLDDTYGGSATVGSSQLCVYPVAEANDDATTGGRTGGTELRVTTFAVMVYLWDDARSEASKQQHVNNTGLVKSVLMRYRNFTDPVLGQLWYGSYFVKPRTTTFYYRKPQRLSVTFIDLHSRLGYV